MNYAAEMDLSAMIHIPISIKIGSAVQKLMGGGGVTYTDTHTAK
jgi:hypothetical protein